MLPPPPPLLPTRGGFPLKTLALALVAGAVAAFALANKEKKSEQPAAKDGKGGSKGGLFAGK